MANQTPLTAILAPFGATCHYLEVTTRALIFFPPYIANSPTMMVVLLIVNTILALGYLVFAWHLLGWIGKGMKMLGTGLDWLHVTLGDLSVRGMRSAALNAIRANRALVRWLK